MQNKKTFGEFLCRKRKENGLTQQEFAGKLYVTESAVSKWERGVSYPDITLIHGICEALHITEHELLTASEDVQTRNTEQMALKYRRIGIVIRYSLLFAFAAGIITCFVCNLAVSGTLSWFFLVLTSEMVAASLILLPLFLPSRRCLWTLGSFTVSLGLLLLACCLYTGGDWFFVSYIPVLLGLCIVFLPFVLKGVPLPSPLSHHKTLICFTVDSLVLLVLLLVCDLYTKGGWFLSIALPSALISLVLPWGIMAIIRYTKLNPFFKSSACFGLSAILDYSFVGWMDFILGQKPYRFGFVFDFSNWGESYLSGNINMIIFLSLLLFALLFAIAGIYLEVSRKRGNLSNIHH